MAGRRDRWLAKNDLGDAGVPGRPTMKHSNEELAVARTQILGVIIYQIRTHLI